MARDATEKVAFGFDDLIANGMDGFLGTIPNISLPLSAHQISSSQQEQQATQYLAGIITASLYHLQSLAAVTWSPGAAEFSERTLRSLVRWATPTPEDRRAREGVITRLSGLAESGIRFCRGLHISAYGSFTSGLYTPHGDLDLSIEGVAIMRDDYTGDSWRVPVKDMQRKERENFLHALAGRVSARGAQKLIRITHARVPIIKFEDHVTGVEVDVAIDSIGAQFKSVAIGIITSMDWRVGALVRLIKLWARQHNLNDSSTGTFNSFALTMLVIFHCQTRTPAILPPLCELFGCSRNSSEDKPEERPMHDGKRPDLYKLRFLQDQFNSRAAAGRNANTTNKNQETLLELLSSFFCTFLGLMKGWCGPDAALSRVLRRVRVDTWHGCLTYRPWTDKKDGVYYCSIEDPFDSTDNVGRTIRESACIQRIIDALDYAVDVCTSSVSSLYSFEQGMEWLFGAEVLETAYFYDQKLMDRGELKDTSAAVLPTMLWIPESLNKYVSRTQPFVEPERNGPRGGNGSGVGGGGGPRVANLINFDIFSSGEVLEFPELTFHSQAPFIDLGIAGAGTSIGVGTRNALRGPSVLSDVEDDDEKDEEHLDRNGSSLQSSSLHWEGLQVLLKKTHKVLDKEAAEEAVREAEKEAQRAARRQAKHEKNEMKKALRKAQNGGEGKKQPTAKEEKPLETAEAVVKDVKGNLKEREEQPAALVEGNNSENRQRRRQRRRNGRGRGSGESTSKGGDGADKDNGASSGRGKKKKHHSAAAGRTVVVPRPSAAAPPGL